MIKFISFFSSKVVKSLNVLPSRRTLNYQIVRSSNRILKQGETVKEDINQLKCDVNQLKGDLNQLKCDVNQLKGDLKNFRTQMQDGFFSIQQTLNRMQKGLGMTLEDYSVAWLSTCISEFTRQEIPADSYKRSVVFTDSEGIVVPAKQGQNVEVELDAHGTFPIHAVAEVKSFLKVTKGKKDVAKILEKVAIFVRKVHFLEKKFGTRPLCFFCVADVDTSVIPVIKKGLEPVNGVLVCKRIAGDFHYYPSPPQ